MLKVYRISAYRYMLIYVMLINLMLIKNYILCDVAKSKEVVVS